MQVLGRSEVLEAGLIGQIANQAGADSCGVPIDERRGLAQFSTQQLFELYEGVTGAKHPSETTGMDHAQAFKIMVQDCAKVLQGVPITDRTLSQLENEAEQKGVNRHVPEAKSASQTAPKSPTPRAKRAPAGSGEATPSDVPTRPVSGTTTGLVWEFCDTVRATMPAAPIGDKALRTEIIAHCVREGIHPATAATQYAKWKRAQDHE